MSSEDDARQAAFEAARHARETARQVRDAAMEEARRLREEAKRVRDEAKRDARDARDEARRHREAIRSHAKAWRDEDRETVIEGSASVLEAFTLEGVRTVDIHQTAGRLTVRLCEEGEKPGVETSGSRSTPELKVTRTGDRLRIDVEISLGRLFRRRQGATTLVRLAPGPSDVRIDAGYGRLDVAGIEAETLTMHVGAGDLNATGTAGRLEADVGAGKIAVSGHRGPATCDMGTGDVALEIADIETGELRISVGMGQADLRLPPGKKVRATATSGIGKGTVDYPQGGDDAPIRVTLNTGVGKAFVHGSGGTNSAAATPAPSRGRSSAPPAGGRSRQSEEVRVLQLLEQGRITSQEAAELIAALRGAPAPGQGQDEPDDA